MLRVNAIRGGATFSVKAHPGAGKTAVTGLWDGALKVSIDRKPEAGAANDALLKFLAKRLGQPRHALSIIKGEFSVHKVIHVARFTAKELEARLNVLLPESSKT